MQRTNKVSGACGRSEEFSVQLESFAEVEEERRAAFKTNQRVGIRDLHSGANLRSSNLSQTHR